MGIRESGLIGLYRPERGSFPLDHDGKIRTLRGSCVARKDDWIVLTMGAQGSAKMS